MQPRLKQTIARALVAPYEAAVTEYMHAVLAWQEAMCPFFSHPTQDGSREIWTAYKRMEAALAEVRKYEGPLQIALTEIEDADASSAD